MKRCIGLIVVSVLFLAPAHAIELVTNGDFEQPLDVGWEQSVAGSNFLITRATNYDPDPDYEVYVRKLTGSGYARLYQTTPIPSTNLDFSVRAKLNATATSTAWAGAAIAISYLDQGDFVLGETYIYVGSVYCPWTSTATLHLIPGVANTWRDYAFNVDDELANFPGIDPLDVRKIEIALLATAVDC